MRREFVLLRKAAIVIVASGSVIGAIGLIWTLVARDELLSLSIPQLLGMVALCLLPAATYAAWEWDRRAAHHRTPPDSLFETPDGIELADEAKSPKARAHDPVRAPTPGRTLPASDQPETHRRRIPAARPKAERE
jgi:hypothetical protein